MTRESINLVIRKTPDSPLVRKLKIIFPIIAATTLALFLLIFFISIAYNNSTVQKYKQLQGRVETLEKKISSQKNKEGIYTLTVSNLSALEQIVAKNKSFSPLLSELYNFKSATLNIESINADNLGNISISIMASSSSALDEFVEALIYKEEAKHMFSTMEAQGITRDKKGQYSLRVAFKADQSLMQ